MVSKQKACKHENANNYDSPSKITLQCIRWVFNNQFIKSIVN